MVYLAAGNESDVFMSSLQPLPTAARRGRGQQVSHPLIIRPVPRPSLGGGPVPVVFHRQIGAVIDEESHGLLIPLNRGLVKNARRLVRPPVGVDVGAALEEKRRDLEV